MLCPGKKTGLASSNLRLAIIFSVAGDEVDIVGFGTVLLLLVLLPQPDKNNKKLKSSNIDQIFFTIEFACYYL